jgi:pimeloyl-ACP methyl ester carboxylesterase
VDAFGHSYGAVCVLGAAARGAPVRRVVLYEPPGPPTVDPGWLERAEALIAAGDPGRAMASFLVDVVGYTWDEVFAMRDAPAAREASEIVERTMVREGHALTAVDLAPLADAVPQPVLLLLGADSPPWAPALTRALHRRLPRATLVVLADQGHEAVDRAPAELARALDDFLAGP